MRKEHKAILSKRDQLGIKMIQALQKAAGIDESDTEALAGWRSMSSADRKKTEAAYDAVCKKHEVNHEN